MGSIRLDQTKKIRKEDVKMEYSKEFEEYLAELFDYNEDLILEYLYDEELYEDFLKQR